MASRPSSGRQQSKKLSKQSSVIYPVCEEPIVDGSEKTPGHDSIECEGLCKGWLHRGCASLSKNPFQVATTSPDPFMCPHCRLVEQAADLASLKCSVRDLAEELSSLKATIVSLQANANASSVSVSCNHAPLPVSASTETAEDLNFQLAVSVSASVPVFSNSVLKRDPHHTSDNIVLFGVEECSRGTSRHERMESDIDNVIEVVSSIDNSIQKHSNKLLQGLLSVGEVQPNFRLC